LDLKKEVPFLIALIVAGTGFFPSFCFGKDQKRRTAKENSLISQGVFLVDKSTGISNISFIPIGFVDNHHIITLIMKI